MTISLPVDIETERLARKLAEATGKTLPVVVRQAIEAEAAKAGVTTPPHVTREELLARMTNATDAFACLPVRDPRSADEIVGYDENGLPN